MIKNRAACAAALVIAAAFYVFYVDYFSYYILVFLLSVIALSALMLIPGVFSVTGVLNPGGARVLRGAVFTLEWALQNRLRLPLVYVGGELHYKNLMTGETDKQRIRAAVPPRGKRLVMEHVPAHCGLIRCELKRMRVYDPLGVFALGRGKTAVTHILSLPTEVPLRTQIDLTIPANARVGKRPGQANPYGNYDIREYRPGDSLRDMHWKASAKLDGLFVKEVNENAPASVLLAADLNLTPDEADSVLTWAIAFSKQLIERRMPFHIAFADTEQVTAADQHIQKHHIQKYHVQKHQIQNHHIQKHYIETEDDLIRALRNMLKMPIQRDAAPLVERMAGLDAVRAFAAKPEGIFDLNRGIYVCEAGAR